MRRSTVIFILLPALSLMFLVEGCAVFGAIGDAVSSGYENTLTYFNVYYNARRAFKDAETEIAAAKKAAEGKTTPGNQATVIPADAQKNLDLVIDKCSNILAYHDKSAYVDDALMMTGKAFYYKGEYSKAERKFLELITKYPNSSLNLEAQLWYARSELRLEEYDDARKSATSLIESAEQGGDHDILAGAYSLMGELSAHDKAISNAVEFYQKSVKTANSDELIADGWSRIGRLYFDDGQYQNSIDASLKVGDYSDDFYQIFESELLATQAYRNLQLLDKALALDNEMAEDYRFNDYLGQILLERATILLMGRRIADAVNLFRALDSTYARTAVGAAADFQLGSYFEQNVGDYANAKEFYGRAITVPGVPDSEQSARKVAAFNAYFADKKDLSNADSLLALVPKVDTSGLVSDSLHAAAKDSSAIVADTSNVAHGSARVSLSADSLNAIEARAAARLGELFYTDLTNPDSAIFWLKFSLLHQYVQHSASRILYILSELAESYPDKSQKSAEEYRAQLVRDFPKSHFARQVQNLPTEDELSKNVVNEADTAYSVAETLIEAGKNEEALAALEKIAKNYPTSPVAARSRYAIGWLYENRLSRMDSAAAEYKLLIAQFPTTPYAQAVSSRMLDTLSSATVKADTASHQMNPQTQKSDTTGVGQASGLNLKQNVAKPPASLSRRARILQSQGHHKSERE